MEPTRNILTEEKTAGHPARKRTPAGGEFSGQEILVVGLGSSGLSTARFLSQCGARVTVSELRGKEEISPELLDTLARLGVRLEAGGHREESFRRAKMILLSPGVPQDIGPLRSAKASGVPVVGELELASRFLTTPVVAVTGTNGKSTVTAFIGSMLENAGYRVFVGGNFGTPLMTYAAGPQDADYVVAEVSSFQLDTIETFRPSVSVILNITPDHLDRYDGFDAYVRSKLRIIENQSEGQVVVLNDEDERLSGLRPANGVLPLRYGHEDRPERNAFIREGEVRTRFNGMPGPAFEFRAFPLPGPHNLENLLAAVLTGLSLSLPPPAVQQTIDTFRGLPNRLERAGESGGIDFFNDSKATNVDAAVRSLLSFNRPLVLIAGGRHKGADYAPLVRAAEGRVKAAVFIGEAKSLLATAFEGVLPFSLAKDMEEAVSRAFISAVRGDVVLLAPACSSFDMFSDYAQRGRAFKAAVEGLIRR